MSGEMETNKAIIDYIDGENDCKNGVVADIYGTEHYQCGYRFQYELEQIRTNKTEGQESE